MTDMFFFLMIRRPPRSTLVSPAFPTLRSSDLAPVHDGIIALSVNGPPQVIPEDMFRAAAERAMRASLALPHGGYADQRGTVEQRRILADWLRRSRVALSEDDLILSVGVQHGVHLAFLDLNDRKSTRLNSSHYCASRMPSSA